MWGTIMDYFMLPMFIAVAIVLALLFAAIFIISLGRKNPFKLIYEEGKI